MDKYTVERFLILLGIIGVDAALIWGLYSIIMVVATGAANSNIGSLVFGLVLLYLFGGLFTIGVIVITILAVIWTLVFLGVEI